MTFQRAQYWRPISAKFTKILLCGTIQEHFSPNVFWMMQGNLWHIPGGFRSALGREVVLEKWLPRATCFYPWWLCSNVSLSVPIHRPRDLKEPVIRPISQCKCCPNHSRLFPYHGNSKIGTTDIHFGEEYNLEIIYVHQCGHPPKLAFMFRLKLQQQISIASAERELYLSKCMTSINHGTFKLLPFAFCVFFVVLFLFLRMCFHCWFSPIN